MCREKQLLVLGLDHTLMYAGALPVAREPDFRLLDYFAYRRPGLDGFLREAFRRFTVGIWSTAPPGYTRKALQTLLPVEADPLFVWDLSHCSDEYDPELCTCVSIRRLRKLRAFGFALGRTILIDYRRECMHANYGNLVPVRPYFGAADDDELELLRKFLPVLDGVSDIRHTSKAYWHAMLSGPAPVRSPVRHPVVERGQAPGVVRMPWDLPGLSASSGA